MKRKKPAARKRGRLSIERLTLARRAWRGTLSGYPALPNGSA